MLSLESLFGKSGAILHDRGFQLLLLANVLPVLGSAVLSPVIDSLIEPLGTSAADVGLLMSVYTAPGIVMIPVAGVLADRYGRKPVLVVSLVLFGAAGTAIAFVTEFRLALGLRLLQGVAYGGIAPVIITSIGDLYRGPEEATGQGIRFMVSGLSGTVFPLISGSLVVFAWQYPFLLYAVAFPIAAAVQVWFREPKTAAGTSTNGAAREGSYRRALVGLLGRRRVLAMVVARSLPVTVWIGFLTYNSLIVVQLIGGTPPQAGALVSVASLVFAIGGSQAGRITATFDSRLYPLLGANVCLGAGFAIPLFAPDIVLAAAGIVLLGIGFGVTLSLYRSIVTDLAPPDLRAGLVGVAEAGGRVGSTLAPIAMGAVIALATPTLGFEAAIRLAGLGLAILAGGGGILCLLVASASGPTVADPVGPADG